LSLNAAMSSEKFALQWNDFRDNIIASCRNFRDGQDFANVTLVSEDNQQVEAHKILLSSSSSFFMDILKKNQHSHPLIYMRGVEHKNLVSLLDFIYYGEASIYQDELEGFLILAEELKLKGLTGSQKNKNKDKDTTEYEVPDKRDDRKLMNESNSVKTITRKPIVKLEDRVENTSLNSSIDNIIAVRGNDERNVLNVTGEEELDTTIDGMVGKIDGSWTCTMCGKTAKTKQNLKSHIENNHIEGILHKCNKCQKQYKSRSNLNSHKYQSHRE